MFKDPRKSCVVLFTPPCCVWHQEAVSWRGTWVGYGSRCWRVGASAPWTSHVRAGRQPCAPRCGTDTGSLGGGAPASSAPPAAGGVGARAPGPLREARGAAGRRHCPLLGQPRTDQSLTRALCSPGAGQGESCRADCSCAACALRALVVLRIELAAWIKLCQVLMHRVQLVTTRPTQHRCLLIKSGMLPL